MPKVHTPLQEIVSLSDELPLEDRQGLHAGEEAAVVVVEAEEEEEEEFTTMNC